MSNKLGIRNNNTIVPYTAATKRTSTVDISSAISGTNITGVTSAKAVFYADSAGKWYMYFNIRITSNSVTSITMAVANILSVSTHRQGYLVNAGGQAAWGDIDPSASTFNLGAGAASTYWLLNDTIELNAEPTAYTIPANMEGVTAVDVLIPFGQTGMPGETLTASDSVAASDSESSALATITLTNGKWLVSACVQSAGTGATLLIHRMYIKGVNTDSYVPPVDKLVSTVAASTYSDHGFPLIPVSVSSADSTKTVHYTIQTGGSTSNIYVAITAVRIAPG